MHPIVQQLQPSNDQWPAISARGSDVVMTAGAGSGKTRTLIARMLALLAEGVPLRRIIAITFTSKAAREMRNRLRREIQRYLDQDTLTEAERERWDAVYRELDAARIGTIHSLCAEILRNHPAEALLDPRFNVLDEARASLLLEDAIQETVGWAADDADAVAIFALLPPSALHDCLTLLLRNRLKADALLERDWWEAWEEPLRELEQFARTFVTRNDVDLEITALQDLKHDGSLAYALNAQDKLAPRISALLQQWAELHAALDAGEDGRAITILSELRSNMPGNVGSAKNWPGPDPKPHLTALRNLYDNEVKPWLATDPALDRIQMAVLPQLRRIYCHARDRYAGLKRELAALDFDDLEQNAVALLANHVDVRTRWQHEVDALLVDEFQDTNGRQRDLVRLLNGNGGRMFIVGDAKQSIYRFRGAEVQVFRTERTRIELDGGVHTQLVTSYRSHEALLARLNTLLAYVLDREPDPERPWREPFARLDAGRKLPQWDIGQPYLEVLVAPGSKGDGALARAAAAIAARLKELVEATPKFNYDGVAVLCRASTSFAAYEDAFEEAGIPYATVAGRGFLERPEVRDVLNALAAISDPTDDVALFGLLRSPAIGFSDPELHWIRMAGGFAPGQLWPALRKDASPRAQRATMLIESLHTEAGRVTVAELLKHFLDGTNYRAGLMAVGQARAARNVAKLLDDAVRSGLVGVGEFLEYVANLRDMGSREGEARTDSEGAVQIMSVHQAKGLEYPVVVVGDAGYAGSRHVDAILLDDVYGLVLRRKGENDRKSPIYTRASARNEDMENAEVARLFYVAATRAQDLLILNGNADEPKGDRLSGKGWLKEILPVLEIEPGRLAEYAVGGNRMVEAPARIAEYDVRCILCEPQFGGAPNEDPAPATQDGARPSIQQPEEIPPDEIPFTGAMLASLKPAQPLEHEYQTPDRVWRVVPARASTQAPSWLIGKLVHDAIAAWRFPSDPSFVPWAAARAQEHGLTDRARIDRAIEKSRLLLRRFLKHGIFIEIESADLRLHEIPYSYARDGQMEEGRIDLLYRRQDQWTVIDFKTDHFATDAAVEAWIDKRGYRDQVARYAAAVTALTGIRPAIKLCLLDHNGAVDVRSMD